MSDDKPIINRARFTLREAAEATGGEILSGQESLELQGVSTDTRAIAPGALFVALRGERFDGHNFLAQAAAAGARAAIVDEQGAAASAHVADGLALIRVGSTLQALGDLARSHRRRFQIPVIGVTGSYGKTTTRALIAAALSPSFVVLSSAANFNNEIGVPLTLLQLDESHGAAVVELAMRGIGQIEYLARIAEPTVGVITNIGPQHVELLGSIEKIAAAKAEVLRFLPADGVAVLPLDDEYLNFFTDQTPCPVVTFGHDPAADFHVDHPHIEDDGSISFALTESSSLKTHHLGIPLPGAHNAFNAAAAMAVAGALGVPLEAAARALQTAQVPGARMRVVKANDITIIDDSYNAGPDSMHAALQTLRDFPHAVRRVAVLGAMKELGQWTEEEHHKIGGFAASCADIVLGVGDETRALLETAQAVGANRSLPLQAEWCADAVATAARAREIVRAGDVVLVKGSRSIGLETVVSALAGE